MVNGSAEQEGQREKSASKFLLTSHVVVTQQSIKNRKVRDIIKWIVRI